MQLSPSPLIVIMAYDRPRSLQRLLASMNLATTTTAIEADVAISIDGGGENRVEVLRVARDFHWEFGHVEIIEQPPLGLVDHFYACGDLTARNGSAVLLEDDLIVGPNFLGWASAALAATADDDRVAGVCLAAPWFDGYRHLPFQPLLDGSAGFYMQIPWFHGMAWTAEKWDAYRDWDPAEHRVGIHRSFDQLDRNEWFPDAVRYLVWSGRYFLAPREANASNTGAAGQHFDHQSDFFQVPIQIGRVDQWPIKPLDDALAVYDDHLELNMERAKRLCTELRDMDLTVDLLAVRDPSTITSEHVLTTRPVGRAERSWGTALRPLPTNLLYDTPGTGISLARRADLRTGPIAEAATRHRLHEHAARGRQPGFRATMTDKVGRIAQGWFDARAD